MNLLHDDVNQLTTTHPTAIVEFYQTNHPIVDTVTKCGGQPVWLQEATWPLSKKTGKPMQFLCQIRIDKELFPLAAEEMAYIFMTDVKEEYVDGTYLAEGGENAVIIQPGNVPVFINTIPLVEGPALEQTFSAHLTQSVEPFSSYGEFYQLLTVLPEASQGLFSKRYEHTKIGGSPIYIQGDETPTGDGWEFLYQMNGRDLPFYINLGDVGRAYVFINTILHEGRMLWQCG